MSDELVEATLSRLRSECELCGAWSRFTGRTEVHDGRTHAVVRCPNGHGDFTVWNRDRVPLLSAYERARESAIDPDAYHRAIAVLTGSDIEAVRSLLASPPVELPLFSIEDVRVRRDSARRWCALLLDWDGWRPRPARRVRIEEALATAVVFEDAGCVELVRARTTRAETDAVLDALERRFYDRDPSVLLPLARDAR